MDTPYVVIESLRPRSIPVTTILDEDWKGFIALPVKRKKVYSAVGTCLEEGIQPG